MKPSSQDVLMIGWEYPPHISGGLGVACQGMTQALAGQNTQIYFTLPFNLNKKVKHMKVIGCTDDLMSDDPNLPPFYAYTELNEQKYKKLISAAELSTLPQSEMEIKVDHYSQLVEEKVNKANKNYDIVHAHDWMSFPAAMNIKKKQGKPFVAHVHSTEYDRIPNGNGSPYITRTEYQGMQLANRIITVSYYTKKLLVDKYGIDAQKIDVVYNGISDPYYPFNKDKNLFASKRAVVSFMGRLTMQKGADYFIELARRVLQEVPDCLFILAGKGDMYHELLFKVAANQLSASVLFSGFVRSKQKDKLLDRTDIFIMPSLSEPFGLVALEAARHHTPVIVSKNSGVSEVLTSSIAIDFWDIDKMSRAVIELLHDQGFGQQVARGQLEELSGLTWDNSAKKIKDVYRKAFFG